MPKQLLTVSVDESLVDTITELQTMNAMHEVRVIKLEAEVKKLRGLLKSIEWVQDPSYPDWHFCPSCDATSDCMLSLRHTDNCRLFAILD